jgi:hypothetical protein
MYHRLAKSVPVLLLSVISFNAKGQTSSVSNPRNGWENNPYSKYGLGELRNGNNTSLRGMGNITSAYSSATMANTDNPASYSSIRRTTFEVGAKMTTRTVEGTDNGTSEKYKSGTASVAYMNLAVPVGKNAGMCFGFRPYSATYYYLTDTIRSTSTTPSPLGDAIKSYRGEGAMNFAFVGGSAKYKGLSVGANFGFLFGDINKSIVLVPTDKLTYNNAYYSQFVTNSRVGGIMWKGGLQYEAKLDSFHVLRVGGTVQLSQKIREHFYETHLAAYNFNDTVIRDTTYSIPEQAGKITMPFSYSAGIVFSRPGKWSVGVDYSATQWSQFSSSLNANLNAGIAASSYKLGLGGEYTPDADNTRRYLSRATYRLGAYYGNDYLKLQGTQLLYYGFTAGFSMPFKRSASQLHGAIDGGMMGTTDNGLMKQSYLRVTLGVTLNDLWFVKRKYE